MSNYNYDRAQMEAAKLTMEEVGAAVQNVVDELDGNAQQYLSTWSGEAYRQYLVRQREWDEAAKGLKPSLNVAETTLQDIFDRYHHTEQNVLGIMGG